MAQNSEQIESKLCAYIEGELDETGRVEIEKHLQANPHHRNLLKELGETRRMVQAAPRESAPGRALRGVPGPARAVGAARPDRRRGRAQRDARQPLAAVHGRGGDRAAGGGAGRGGVRRAADGDVPTRRAERRAPGGLRAAGRRRCRRRLHAPAAAAASAPVEERDELARFAREGGGASKGRRRAAAGTATALATTAPAPAPTLADGGAVGGGGTAGLQSAPAASQAVADASLPGVADQYRQAMDPQRAHALRRRAIPGAEGGAAAAPVVLVVSSADPDAAGTLVARALNDIPDVAWRETSTQPQLVSTDSAPAEQLMLRRATRCSRAARRRPVLRRPERRVSPDRCGTPSHAIGRRPRRRRRRRRRCGCAEQRQQQHTVDSIGRRPLHDPSTTTAAAGGTG